MKLIIFIMDSQLIKWSGDFKALVIAFTQIPLFEYDQQKLG